MVKVRKYSATRLIADALSIEEKLVPESLRNRINTYKNNDTIPPEMFDITQGVHYSSVEFKPGNLTYIRNLIILDTLFDNTQYVKKLMLNSLERIKKEQLLDNLFVDIIARKNILNAVGSQLKSIKSVLMLNDFDMGAEELPNPFSDGCSVANLLICQIDNQRPEQLSTYDEVLKEVLAKRYDKADELLSLLPDEISTKPEYCVLKEIVKAGIGEAKTYNDFLKNL